MEDNKEVMNTNEEFDEENFEVEESDAKFGLTEVLLVGAGLEFALVFSKCGTRAEADGKENQAKAKNVMEEKEDKHHSVNDDGTIEANASDVIIVEENENKG